MTMSPSQWLLIPLVLVCLTGLSVNAYILLVISISKQFASVNNLLLLHLAALNILLGVTFLVYSAPGLQSTNLEWSSKGIPCELHGFLFTLLHPVVIWTVCGLNADRYYAIAAPLHYGRLVNPQKVLFGLGLGWLISLMFTVPPLLRVTPNCFNEGLGACVPNGTIWYATSYTAITLLLPLTIMVCCNVKILLIARYHRHRIASAIYEVTLSAQVTITHQRNPFFVPTVTAPVAGGPRFRSRSPVSTVLQLLGSFVTLYVPYYLITLWQSATLLHSTTTNNFFVHPAYYRVVLVLLTASPTVNGFLYGLRNKSLRKTIQNYWRKKVTKSEVNQEIQARTPSTCGSRRQSLTPMGFFLFKPPANGGIPRRLSEALLRTTAGNEHQGSIKRASSELINLRSSALGPRVLSIQPIDSASIESSKNGKSVGFLKKIFGIDGVAPKILITRALSDQQPNQDDEGVGIGGVAGGGAGQGNLSTYSLSKLPLQKIYDSCDCFDPNSKTKLLDLSSATYEADDDDDDSPSSLSVDYMPPSDASSGLYMNLDTDCDRTTTQSLSTASEWPNRDSAMTTSSGDECYASEVIL